MTRRHPIISLFRVWRYVAVPALAIPFVGMMVELYRIPSGWMVGFPASMIVVLLGFLYLKYNESLHCYEAIPVNRIMIAFLVGLVVWAFFLIIRLQNKHSLMDSLAWANLTLFGWALVYVGPGPLRTKHEN